MDKTNEGLKDLQGLQWQPEIYNSLLTELQRGINFRNCIDNKLGIHKLKGYDEFMKDIKNKNFKIGEQHLKFIQSASDKFISLTPEEIKICIDKLSYSEVLKKNICNGDITFTMMESINLIFEFIGIHINLKDLSNESIIKLTPYIKNILYKIITTSEYYEQTLCDGKISNITKNLKTLYNELFQKSKSTEYPFKNIKLDFGFFDDFTKTFYGKVILLIFIAFIFSQMVKLFSNKGEVIQK